MTDVGYETAVGASPAVASPEHVADARWPERYDLFGVHVSATCYDDVVDCVIDAARSGRPATVDFMAVHGLVSAIRDPAQRDRLNCFDIIAPDGQPVRWALNRFHRAGLTDRVYGPEAMRRLVHAAAEQGIGIYLYGSSQAVIERLRANLQHDCPTLTIAGAEPSLFRPLTDEESEALVQRINTSGAGLVFVGLGCPRQEVFAFEHRERIKAVQLCVGAAFDFHAGTKPMAPAWMQRRGLEWLYRMLTEPGRLWQRYLITNAIFSFLYLRRLLLN
ncbi:WecB/TagA/CpsF family glycosyltransferase [Phycisphaerales bacterium AB-hyl4]|uniref:WecB/TagA/CpsF family glycosyltransferase n=1 Tax=Natronomicrosphaera hydrolytica TaxID=3242702 RepID=A0ABV4U5Q5_9BACT